MLMKLIPLALALAGLGAGVGAGIALKPDAEPALASAEPGPCGEDPNAAHESADAGHDTGSDHGSSSDSEFITLDDQFVIPVVEGDKVKSLVVMSLTLEVGEGLRKSVSDRMPKLRDGFLRVMLDHANVGGFDGAFTANGSMESLRRGFVETARAQFPTGIRDVLVLDINRQDMG